MDKIMLLIKYAPVYNADLLVNTTEADFFFKKNI